MSIFTKNFFTFESFISNNEFHFFVFLTQVFQNIKHWLCIIILFFYNKETIQWDEVSSLVLNLVVYSNKHDYLVHTVWINFHLFFNCNRKSDSPHTAHLHMHVRLRGNRRHVNMVLYVAEHSVLLWSLVNVTVPFQVTGHLHYSKSYT